MNRFLSSSHLKANAREQLLGHYGSAIGGLLLMFIIPIALNILVLSSFNTYTLFGTIFYYIFSIAISVLSGMLSAGYYYFCLKLSCNQHTSAADVFYMFQHNSSKAALLSLFIAVISEVLMIPTRIFTAVYNATGNVYFLLSTSLSLVIFGIILIIFILTFSLVYFILLDFPEYSVGQIIQSSAQVMRGSKGRLFYIYVSFIPLFLLSLLSFGLALLWVIPYMESTLTNFYLDTMRNRSH